jgi:hypothetical protein
MTRGASVLLPALLLTACSARVAFPPIDRSREVTVAPSPYGVGPWNATFQQRWIIERGGTEAVFTVYLKVSEPDRMHMVAVGDLGTTLCEVTRNEIKRESRAFPGRLARWMLEDIRPLFQPYPDGVWELVIAEGEAAMYHEQGDERVLWRAGGMLTTYAKIDFKRWDSGVFPAVIEINGRYKATVETKAIDGP